MKIINESERKSLKGKLELNKELFEKMGVITPSFLFKEVFTIKGNEEEDWILYAVNELSNNDYDIIKGKCTEEGSKPLWCDLIIDYLKNLECSSIHLFLHDRDIFGFSVDSITHIDDIMGCKEMGVISANNDVFLKGKKLTITFFKHDNPLIIKLIGENATTEGIQERFTDFLNNKVGKIVKLRESSINRYNTITKNEENNLHILKECPFVKITKQE